MVPDSSLVEELRIGVGEVPRVDANEPDGGLRCGQLLRCSL